MKTIRLLLMILTVTSSLNGFLYADSFADAETEYNAVYARLGGLSKKMISIYEAYAKFEEQGGGHSAFSREKELFIQSQVAWHNYCEAQACYEANTLAVRNDFKLQYLLAATKLMKERADYLDTSMMVVEDQKKTN